MVKFQLNSKRNDFGAGVIFESLKLIVFAQAGTSQRVKMKFGMRIRSFSVIKIVWMNFLNMHMFILFLDMHMFILFLNMHMFILFLDILNKLCKVKAPCDHWKL